MALEEARERLRWEEARHKLLAVQTPFCVALGGLIYLLGMRMNPAGRVMRNFTELLTRNGQLRRTLSTLNRHLVTSHGQVPEALRVPLGQLAGVLQASDIRPSQMYPYLDQIRIPAGSANPHLSVLADQVQRYKAVVKRVMRDRQGLELLADEPVLLRKMALTSWKAREMARKNPEELFVRLFRQGLSDDRQLNGFLSIFKTLGTRQNLIVRLAAFSIPGFLYGYFFSKLAMAQPKS
jgi:hypothetical protein